MARKIHITEDQYNHIVNEMAYPVGFNMKELLSIPTYAGRIRYCDEHLKRIGNGSSRLVYAVDDEKVLKVAKNTKGIAQNQEESQGWKQSYDCFAEVYDGDDDGIFLEMQTARKAKKSDFKRLTGYDFDVMCAWIDYTWNCYTRERRLYYQSWKKYEELFDSEEWRDGLDNYNIFESIYNYLCDTGLESVGDFKRISSWGVVSQNGEESLVLIDFGLSDEIYDQYYNKWKR